MNNFDDFWSVFGTQFSKGQAVFLIIFRHDVPRRPLAAHKTPQDPPKTRLGRGQDAQETPKDARKHAPEALGTAQDVASQKDARLSQNGKDWT